MSPLFSLLPVDGAVRLRRARVPAVLLHDAPSLGPKDAEGLVDVDIDIAQGRIDAIAPAGTLAAAGSVDLDRGQVWPALADLHTHLDKGHILPRAVTTNGTLGAAVVAATADRAHWSAQDLHQRMEFGLRCAYAHGTMAVRTHVDSNGAQGEISWPVIARLRESWRGRIALQAVGMVSIESYLSPQAEQFAQVMARQGGLLGGSTRLLGNDPDNARLRASVDRLFQLAAQYDLDVDVHVDETADPASNTLADVADAAIHHRYQGRVTAGHCCSLAMQSQDVADRTLDLCAQAQLAIVSLPMCNLYLQGRERDRTPRWRGVTLAHEIAARGIPLAFASDNCRDPFFAFGDHDMLEVFNQSVRIAQLDLPYAPWPAAVSTTPASVMKLESRMLRAGGPADLILFRARTMSELLSRPQWDRAVLRDGRAIDTTLPDYRELDALHPALEA